MVEVNSEGLTMVPHISFLFYQMMNYEAAQEIFASWVLTSSR